MGILDRLLAPTVSRILSDRAATRAGRHRSGRQIPERIHRDYELGSAQSSRLTRDWVTVPATADLVVRKNLRVLRARSREAAANYDHAAKFLRMLETNVVGERGIVLQGRALNADGQPDELTSGAIERAWAEWSRFADIGGRLDWTGLERLFIRNAAQDGEVLIRIVRGPQAGPFGFALHFLDPDLLDLHYEEPWSERRGTYVRMGVECDRWDRPVAYHLVDTRLDWNLWSTPTGYGQKPIRVPADEMIHAFLVERVTQKRGLPWMATPLFRLRMLETYEDAAVVASRVGAAKMGFLQSDAGDEARADELEGGDEGAPKLTDVEPGIVEELADGQTFVGWDPSYPHEQFPEFVKAMLRGISAGLGVSYHSLSGDLEGVNFSSIRAGMLEERDVWKTLQSWTVSQLHDRVFREWLPMALLTGKIRDVKGDPLRFADIAQMRRVSWQGRRWEWVDPEKDTKAGLRSVGGRIRSPQDLIRERGKEPTEVWQEIAEAKRVLEEMGIPWEVYQEGTTIVSGGATDEE